MKRVICLCLILIIIFCLTACNAKNNFKVTEYEKKVPTNIPKENIIAENDNYILEWDKVNAGISLIEKSTSKRWGTTPIKEGEPTVDEYGMPIKRNPQLQSSLSIEYLSGDLKQVKTAISYTGAFKNGSIVTETVKNGIKIKYYFDKEKIMVPVEYILRNDGVAVNFNPKDIEESENLLLSVAIAPFWCSAENDSAGSYIFVPSGSGALVSCKTLSNQGSKYTYSVYGDDAVMQKEDLVTTEENVLLPVYGVKNGGEAVCAIIEGAAESAKINTILGSSSIGYSTVYASYQIRGYSSNVATMLNNTAQKRDVFADNIAIEPMTVSFYPLTDENANYSGMANTYKKYLKSQKYLSKKTDDSILNITLVGGTMIDKSFLGIPYRDLLAATTINDARVILDEISSKTNAKINAKLMGFGETGIDILDYASGFSINDNIGTIKELSQLSDFCKNSNIDLFFDFDLIRFKEKSSGYNTWFDVAYNACNKTAMGYEFDIATNSRIEDQNYYFLSRLNLQEGADKLQDSIKKWNLTGLSLSTLSNIAYSDYSVHENNDYYSKSNMGRDVKSIISKLSKDYKFAATKANEYAAVLADVIYDVPSSSTMDKSFICDIPFYQIIFKGYVPMSSTSINLASDTKKQILFNIESGCGISYTLTNEYYNEFIDSNTHYFYGTKYEDIKNSIFTTYNDLKDFYKSVNGAEIKSHNILDNGIRETVYDNGIKVYVNYTDVTAESPIGMVESFGYLWR